MELIFYFLAALAFLIIMTVFSKWYSYYMFDKPVYKERIEALQLKNQYLEQQVELLNVEIKLLKLSKK